MFITIKDRIINMDYVNLISINNEKEDYWINIEFTNQSGETIEMKNKEEAEYEMKMISILLKLKKNK